MKSLEISVKNIKENIEKNEYFWPRNRRHLHFILKFQFYGNFLVLNFYSESMKNNSVVNVKP